MAQVDPEADKANQRDSSADSDDGEKSERDQHNYFTCLVCMRTAHIPRVSFCGHHFCAKCIRNWMKTQGARAKCPYCQSRIGENTLITVRHTKTLERSLSCRTIEQHRRRMLMSSDYVRELAILPEASMFMRGYIEYPPEAMPRIRALPPQMLRQLSSQPVRRKFLDPLIFQRGMTFVITLFLFAMYLNGL
ncbi:LON peptidase N-terminal domain and RING finger protein 2 [Drosophila biarmipes]|uniref:LON peptidase N-terminal domain and RING finger protein 2 n=1 Tax=Drosophila biarmipes TaxID=125945 RepID=UPI0007E872AA|nr:LON peptidase N-terminal domain and RING finger protein 2 [Drosophila biarmipes]